MANLSFMFIKDLILCLLRTQGQIFSALWGILCRSSLEKLKNNGKCINKQSRCFTYQTITVWKVKIVLRRKKYWPRSCYESKFNNKDVLSQFC